MSLPNVIGRYEIVRQIGQGGMGKVLLAWDPMLEREVTLKLLSDVENRDLRSRFTREARSAARLRHPNIVTIFDVGEDSGQPFIAMEYIQGQTLEEMITEKVPLSVARKVQLMEEVCAGLGYAHKSGIVHRDIKPANLMVDPEGVLQILDFGIVHVAGSGITQSGMLMGTLNYMSPEQLTGKPLDQRSDLFACGAVFYEFLSGKQAFAGTLHDGLFNRIVNEPPEPLEALCPDLPRDVIDVVSRALAKRPEDRYPDAATMRADLQRTRKRLELAEPGDVAAPGLGEATELGGYRARAKQALDEGDYEKAIAASEDVLMRRPDDSGAAEMLDQARVAIDKKQASEWLNEASERLGRKDLSGAASLVDQVLTIAPDSPRALELRAQIDAERRAAVKTPSAGVRPKTPSDGVRPSVTDDNRDVPRRAATDTRKPALLPIAVGMLAIAAVAAYALWPQREPAAVAQPTSLPAPVVDATPVVPPPAAPESSTPAPQTPPPTTKPPADQTRPAASAPVPPITRPQPQTLPLPKPSTPQSTISAAPAQPPAPPPPAPTESSPPIAPPPAPQPAPQPPPVVTTPPVASAPKPEPQAPPSAPKPAPIDEEAAVRATLRAYERAYSSLDAQAVKRIFPNVNADALGRAFAQLREQSVVIRNERVKVTGTTATVSGTVTQSFTPRVGSRGQTSVDAQFQLQKTEAGWIITERR